MQKVDPDITQWHMRWSRGVPGIYTERPHHAMLAVSSAVASSFVAAASSATARLATSYHDECALCGRGGRDLLLCDSDPCQNVAHVRCGAKLVQVPKGAWFCLTRLRVSANLTGCCMQGRKEATVGPRAR